jgi:hypothetical protein
VFRSEVQELIFLDGRLKRRALRFKVGNQLCQPARIHHRARENMPADRCAFFDDRNLNFTQRVPFPLSVSHGLVVLVDESRQMESSAQIRRPRTDKHHIHFQTLAFHHQ